MVAIQERPAVTHGHSTLNAFYQSRHHQRLTGYGRKALDGCQGPYVTSCRAAFPRSRFAWCEACKR